MAHPLKRPTCHSGSTKSETGLDGSETFALTAEEFSDLITVQLADHLEGFEHQMNQPGVKYISHAATASLVGGEYHERLVRLSSTVGAMAQLPTACFYKVEKALSTVPPGSQPAKWQSEADRAVESHEPAKM